MKSFFTRNAKTLFILLGVVAATRIGMEGIRPHCHAIAVWSTLDQSIVGSVKAAVDTSLAYGLLGWFAVAATTFYALRGIFVHRVSKKDRDAAVKAEALAIVEKKLGNLPDDVVRAFTGNVDVVNTFSGKVARRIVQVQTGRGASVADEVVVSNGPVAPQAAPGTRR